MVEEFTFTYDEKKKMAAQTAEILTEEIGLKGDAIQAVHLIPDIEEGKLSMADVEAQYGSSVARILEGLDRIRQLYKKTPAVESENFRNLLLSLAEDMRVILIMIADRADFAQIEKDGRSPCRIHCWTVIHGSCESGGCLSLCPAGPQAWPLQTEE